MGGAVRNHRYPQVSPKVASHIVSLLIYFAVNSYVLFVEFVFTAHGLSCVLQRSVLWHQLITVRVVVSMIN